MTDEDNHGQCEGSQAPEPMGKRIATISLQKVISAIRERKIAELSQSAHQEQLTKEKQDLEYALRFDFSTLPNHPCLAITKTETDIVMGIDLDFFQADAESNVHTREYNPFSGFQVHKSQSSISPFISVSIHFFWCNSLALLALNNNALVLAAIPEYAAIIPNSNVAMVIKSPIQQSLATYDRRAQNIIELIDIINKVHVSKLEVVAYFPDYEEKFEKLILGARA